MANSPEEVYDEVLAYYEEASQQETEKINRAWFAATGKEAGNRLNTLTAAKNSIDTDLLKNKKGEFFKTQATLTKHLKAQQAYARILAELSKSYIFVQKVRKDITKENFEYLLNLHLPAENEQQKPISKVVRASLKDLLPSFGVVMNKDQSFALAITEVQKLKDADERGSLIEAKNGKAILDLAAKIQKDFLEKSGKKYVYGMGGISFESAARKLADGIQGATTPEQIQGSWDDFQKDIQVFYKAGDLSAEQVKKLFGLEKTVMELKRISLKTNSVGAGIAKDRTIEDILQKIKDICDNKGVQEGKRELKKLFSASKEDNTKRTFSIQLDETVEKIVEDNINLT
jgi:hypothetical protein